MTFDINEKSQVIESLLTGECSVVTKTFQPDFYCLIPPLLKCDSEVSRFYIIVKTITVVFLLLICINKYHCF